MVIRFLQRWRQQKPGTVTEWPDGAANVLIKRGIAIAVVNGDYETAMAEPAREVRAPMRKGAKHDRK